ncbi:MAG: hypothetical protein Q3980_13710 [Turicibacter sp.]|nr:hypothetical protein [Turicibacter sp.]
MKKRWFVITLMLIMSGYLISCSQTADDQNNNQPNTHESTHREPWSLIY